MDTVEEIGQGRIWSGKDALHIGLVDALGGLQDAIEAAADLADIKTYNLVDYPKYDEDIQSILFNAFSEAKAELFQHPLERYTSELIEPSLIEGIQTRIPYSIKME